MANGSEGAPHHTFSDRLISVLSRDTYLIAVIAVNTKVCHLLVESADHIAVIKVQLRHSSVSCVTQLLAVLEAKRW